MTSDPGFMNSIDFHIEVQTKGGGAPYEFFFGPDNFLKMKDGQTGIIDPY